MRHVLMLWLVFAGLWGLVLAAGCSSEPADAGPTEQCVFDVQGMTCEGCAGTVRTAVEKLPGVKSVEVSLEKNQVVVVADPTKTAADTILAAITDSGYEAQLAGEAPDESAEPETEEQPNEPQSETESMPEPPAA